MKKKKISDKPRSNEVQKLAEDVKTSKPADEQTEMTNEYGGLPMRDLKKNLGCG